MKYLFACLFTALFFFASADGFAADKPIDQVKFEKDYTDCLEKAEANATSEDDGSIDAIYRSCMAEYGYTEDQLNTAAEGMGSSEGEEAQ